MGTSPRGSIKPPNGFGKIDTAIRPVVTVTKSNVSRVINDGYVKKSDVCNGISASLCNGI